MRTESLLCPKCSMAFFSRSCRCPSSVFSVASSIALARLLAANACKTSRTPTMQNPMVFNTSYFSLLSPKSCCKELAVPSLKMTNPASKARNKTTMKRILSICSHKHFHNFDENARTSCVACLIYSLKRCHKFEIAFIYLAINGFQEREESNIFDILQVFHKFMNMSGRIVGLILFGLL